MRKYAFGTGLVVLSFMVAILFPLFQTFGQVAHSTDPIFGTWKLDQSKSVNNRSGDHATFPTQHIRTLTPESGGLRNTLSYSATSTPVYSYSGKFDGKDRPDPRTPEKNQTLAHWRLSPDLIVRLQKSDGKASEWVIYTVSSDGNVFTSISWAPAHPDLQDVQVFTRVK